MLICIGVTPNYPLPKSVKALIYASFNGYKRQNFGYISYGILTVENNKVHIQIYKNTTNYILDLLDLDPIKDYGREKGEWHKSGRFSYL